MWMKVASTAACFSVACYASYRIYLWKKKSSHHHVDSSRCETLQENNKDEGHVETKPGNKTGSEEVTSLHDDQQDVRVVTVPPKVTQDNEEDSNVVRAVKATDVHVAGDSKCVPHITTQNEVNITPEIAAAVSAESKTVSASTFDSVETDIIKDNTSCFVEPEIISNNTLSTAESKRTPDITSESNTVPNTSDIIESNVAPDNTSHLAESNMAPKFDSTESKIFPVPDNTLGSFESNITTDDIFRSSESDIVPDITFDSSESNLLPNNASDKTKHEILPNNTFNSTESETLQEILSPSVESNTCTEVLALAENAVHAAVEVKCTAVENGQQVEDKTEAEHLEISSNDVATVLSKPPSIRQSSTLQWIKPIQERDLSTEAYVTMTISSETAQNALLLARSLQNAGSQHHLVVLTGPFVSDRFRYDFQQIGAQLVEVELLNIGKPKLALLCAKLQIWMLENYDKCIFISPACKVLKNIDHLFNSEELSAVPSADNRKEFDTRLLVYSPSSQTYNQLLDFVLQTGYEDGERAVLNQFFKRWRHIRKHSSDSTPSVINTATNTVLF